MSSWWRVNLLLIIIIFLSTSYLFNIAIKNIGSRIACKEASIAEELLLVDLILVRKTIEALAGRSIFFNSMDCLKKHTDKRFNRIHRR